MIRTGRIKDWGSGINKTLFSHGGAEFLSILVNGYSARSSVRNQADILYFSGHGHSIDGSIDAALGGVLPEDMRWGNDLEIAIIAGCAVLDVNDYNGNYDDDNSDGDGDRSTGVEVGPGNLIFPGERWAWTGPKILLGYNYVAPGDDPSEDKGTANLIKEFMTQLPSKGSITAVCSLWMDLNLLKAKNTGWSYTNACAIFSGDGTSNGARYYMYFQKTGPLSGIRVVEISQ